MSKKKKKPLPDPESLALPAGGVETHAHLDLEDFQVDMEAVIERAGRCGVSHIGQVFLGPTPYSKGRERFSAFENVFFLLGMHPHEASACDAATIQAMRELFLADTRLKALGEIGLDYHYMHSPAAVQRDVLQRQLELALDLDLRVVIHSREAEDETVEILESMGFTGRPLLWHCFGQGPELAAKLVANGWHLSIPGPVTFPKSEALRQAVTEIPLDRLVLETDCPYLTPAPYRGRRNEPAYLVFTAKTMAACKGISPEELWTTCGANARRFFGLD